MNIIWRDIKGYEGLYMVSNIGTIWSCRKKREMSTILKPTGYLEVVLIRRDGIKAYERVHRLVALAFCDKPEGATVVHHKNEIKSDNRAENLEWTTVSGNTKDFTDKHPDFIERLSNKARESNVLRIEVYKDGEYIGTYEGKAKVAEMLGISEKTIYNRLNEKYSSRTGWDFKIEGDLLS